MQPTVSPHPAALEIDKEISSMTTYTDFVLECDPEQFRREMLEETGYKVPGFWKGKALSDDHRENIGAFTRGKSYEEIFGAERAKELKEARSEGNRNRKRVKWTKESRDRFSAKCSGSNNPKAKEITIKYKGEKLHFVTCKEAAAFLSAETGFKQSSAVNTIRRKLNGQSTNRIALRPLYDSFSIV